MFNLFHVSPVGHRIGEPLHEECLFVSFCDLLWLRMLRNLSGWRNPFPLSHLQWRGQHLLLEVLSAPVKHASRSCDEARVMHSCQDCRLEKLPI